ncbi:cytochrome b/b6 domain-containing protein [Imhoffiella purpurea]|uniref:Ni,Fe-hydrogenase I cytochrome b subunit n=1 Tax=Imhoffiella purpurea TaxID=1249627 RepID=W9VY18_9GAMM|nr:cytochrome b/b6 domain-containing protein [Imhoffiella purpurea]EXJ15300.1 Ni,Fe-hydrogenase I cytochrome b subunit [Imhoffiella purpurea]
MQSNRIKLWDLPTRITHWALFVLVALAFVTGLTGGNLIVWHGWIGLAILGLIVFRLAWGLVGSTYVRFATFVRGPGAILDYLRGRWHGLGHNPLGALSVLALIGLLLFQSLSGLFATDDIAFEGPLNDMVNGNTGIWLSGLHRQAIWLIGGLVCLHICAILFYTLVKRDNLVIPMLSGYKSVSDPNARSATGGGPIAFILSVAIAAGAVWVADGGLIPPPPPPPPASAIPNW